VGTFEVKSLLGRGGMGEVYRAHDTRLAREARVVASLNHPHIAAIHGIEESEGVRGLVLELVEGETLAQKIAHASESSKRGLRLQEALNYARQIADAIEAAHEKGSPIATSSQAT
jgi:eukaryotic-like serine/threonine-protein kinase